MTATAKDEYEAAEGHFRELVEALDAHLAKDAEKINLYKGLGHFLWAVQKDMSVMRRKIDSLEDDIKKLRR